MNNINELGSKAGLAVAEAQFRVEEKENGTVEMVSKHSVVPYIQEVVIEPLYEDFMMPEYAKDGDSGLDVFSPETVIIEPDNTVIIPLGFKMEIPRHPMHEYGYRWEVQARPRGGISANTPLRVANTPGTIDNGFRGNIGIMLHNAASLMRDTQGFILKSDYVTDLKNVRSLNAPNADKPNEVLPTPDGTYLIKKGDKIAQLVFVEVIRPLKLTIGKVNMDTDRGADAYSSTGLSHKNATPEDKK